MSEAKHTPGPWRAGRSDMSTVLGDGTYGKWIYAENLYIASASDRDVVSWDTTMANAHLIAAAPELLDSLKETIRILKAVTYTADPSYLSERIERAEKVIAKAEGRA